MGRSPSGVAIGVQGAAQTPPELEPDPEHELESSCHRQNWPSHVTFRPHVLVRQAVPGGRLHAVPSLGRTEGQAESSTGAGVQLHDKLPCVAPLHENVQPGESQHALQSQTAPVEKAHRSEPSVQPPDGTDEGHATGICVQ